MSGIPPFSAAPPIANYFNVFAYGALGNNTGDDGIAFGKAVAASYAMSNSSGGTIYIPPGKFQVKTETNLNSSNAVILGSGNASQVFVGNTANIRSAIAITGTGTIECQIRNIYINGNNANNSNGDGIYFNTPWQTEDTHHVLEDVFIQSAKNNGIEIATSSDTRVLNFSRVRVKGCSGNNYYLAYPSCTDCTFNDCISDQAGLSGFYIGGANIHFTDCKAFYNGVSGTGMGYQIIGYTNYFTTCEAQDNYQQGFYGDNTGDATYGCFGCTFDNCIADSNGQTGGSTAIGLHGHGVKQWQIRGGSFMNRAYGSYWQNYGIVLDSGADQNYTSAITAYGNNIKPYSDISTGANFYIPGAGNNPWESTGTLNVRNYGAIGNGKRVYGVTSSSVSTTVTIPSGSVVTADIGKNIVVYTDSAAGTITTIAGITDATHITLSANAGITVSNTGYIVFGTDDSTIINKVLTLAGTMVASANSTDPNQPIGSGHVTVSIPGNSIESMYIFTNQLIIPAGVNLDAQGTLINMMPSRNQYGIQANNYSNIYRAELENLFGNGVNCGVNSLQAHITIGTLRVWHSNGSGVAPVGLNGSTSTSGGTLSANTRYYVVTAIDSSGGETAVSNEVSITSTGSTSSNTLNWTAFSGAVSYKIYRGTAAGAENLYFTSATNSYVDTGGSSSNGYPMPTGIAVRLNGYHYEINSIYAKVANLGIMHYAGSDCVIDHAYAVGCVTGVRMNATNQCHYGSLFLDTCGGSGSYGGVMLDNGCSDISIPSIQAFQVSGTSGSLITIANLGNLTSTAKQTDIIIGIQGNNTGGIGVTIANSQDVTVTQTLSNQTFSSGINNAILTGVSYGSGLAGFINVTGTYSSNITPSTGTQVGTHSYQNGTVQVFTSSVGIGVSAPTAALHLQAGVATANGAPLKLSSGTNLSTIENGTFEYDGSHLYFSISGTRHTLI